MGTDDSALQAVVAADVELMDLRQEETEILARQEADENGHGTANGETSAGATQEDDDSDRLNEIYERMQVRTSRRLFSDCPRDVQCIFKFLYFCKGEGAESGSGLKLKELVDGLQS